MPNSRPVPAQFDEQSASGPLESAAAEARALALPPRQPAPARGDFIMSGSLTPLVDVARDPLPEDLPGGPAQPMPGFHRRQEVQRLLARWRNGLTLWGRILGSQSRGPWDDSLRFEQPSHMLYIK
ncbi:hypothetical protein [Arthrobacter sp. CP30]